MSALGTLHQEQFSRGKLESAVAAAGHFGGIPGSVSAIAIRHARSLTGDARVVDSPGKTGSRFLWSLTTSGEKEVRTLLGLPDADVEIEHDVSSLEKLLAGLADRDVANYIQESITCLSVGALRAAVVFLWEGAVRDIQKRVIAKGLIDANAAFQRHDSRSRMVKRLDDLEYIKEKVLILSTENLAIFDKSERTTLEQALDLRNKCGHPAKYNPGPKKVSSFIEDVVGIVFKIQHHPAARAAENSLGISRMA